MTGLQIGTLTAALVILLGVAGLAQLGWLPRGKGRTAVVFAAGVAVSLSLGIAGLPPLWFSGSKAAFGMAASFTLGAFAFSAGEERSFGLPLLLGMGLTLLLFNIVQAVRNVL
jgi:hypothetical protein